MDVHPPHGPIHTVKEFMVHLLAITIGLLIALGLEGSVEWVHHRHLARDARENIFQEKRQSAGCPTGAQRAARGRKAPG
jgi:hypothetical protein